MAFRRLGRAHPRRDGDRAGDGPTCQNWGTTALVSRQIFDPNNGLPDETRQEVARRLLHEGLRMVASNAETGVGQSVVARRPTAASS